MNKFFIFSMLFAALVLTGCSRPAVVAAQPAEAEAIAEISFTFTRQGGLATNQFAVWIEDAQGRHVKTLYATKFTANGGWRRRDTSIPQWVKQSGIADLPKTQIDSLTGATPKAGTLIYRWDGTDSRNTTVPPGNYVIYLEGTLRWANRVIYRAPISIGQGPATSEVTSEYIGETGAEQNMINSVIVRTLR